MINKTVSVIMASAIIAITSFVFMVNKKISSSTEIYKISPTSIKPSSKKTATNYSFDPKSQELIISSDNDVIVIADPGESFSYVAIWIVELPNIKSLGGTKEFNFKLTEFSSERHIHGPKEQRPEKIIEFIKNMK